MTENESKQFETMHQEFLDVFTRLEDVKKALVAAHEQKDEYKKIGDELRERVNEMSKTIAVLELERLQTTPDDKLRFVETLLASVQNENNDLIKRVEEFNQANLRMMKQISALETELQPHKLSNETTPPTYVPQYRDCPDCYGFGLVGINKVHCPTCDAGGKVLR